MGAINPGLAEIAALPLRLFQDRPHPHQQRQFAVGRVEGKRTERGPVCSIFATLAQTAV